MKKNKIILKVSLIIVILLAVLIIKTYYIKYDINKNISSYDLDNEKDKYLDYLKKEIYPENLRSFIYNDYITLGSYDSTATGQNILMQMKFKAYKMMFVSLFDKSRTNFSDCPVSDNFKNKFNVNLIDYFNLYAADDYNVNCNLDMENKNFTIEIYGIEGYSENLEPNYRNTYNFHYTLDDEDNVDDIIFTEKTE